MKKIILYFSITILFQIYSNQIFAQIKFTQEDKRIFDSVVKVLNQKLAKNLSVQELILFTGKIFLGKPYVANTLEGNDPEQVVINLRQFDCVTFVENTLAIALLVKENALTFDNFCKKIEFIRYRNGKNIGYQSRLHYFAEWIYNNENKNILQDITKTIGGETYKKNINYMSQHPAQYTVLQKHTELVDSMKIIENNINLHSFSYVPKQKVNAVANKIQTGDIIGITINHANLDMAHTGIAVVQNKKLLLLHASLDKKKVVLSEVSLHDYLQPKKHQTGIMVTRMK